MTQDGMTRRLARGGIINVVSILGRVRKVMRRKEWTTREMAEASMSSYYESQRVFPYHWPWWKKFLVGTLVLIGCCVLTVLVLLALVLAFWILLWLLDLARSVA